MVSWQIEYRLASMLPICIFQCVSTFLHTNDCHWLSLMDWYSHWCVPSSMYLFVHWQNWPVCELHEQCTGGSDTEMFGCLSQVITVGYLWWCTPKGNSPQVKPLSLKGADWQSRTLKKLWKSTFCTKCERMAFSVQLWTCVTAHPS